MIKLFLCGDVMTGRGIDQALPFPGNPLIYEPYVQDARVYVELAQRKNGFFQIPVSFEYIWGEALEEFQIRKPDFRLINLETSVTQSKEYWEGKGINYKMNPLNIESLSVAKIDYCSMANNHVLDWGYQGLSDTLKILNQKQISCAGAGLNLIQAMQPAILSRKHKRVLVFSLGTSDSGIPEEWKAESKKPGVFYLVQLSSENAHYLSEWIEKFKKPGDIVVVSIHWGGNWVHKIPRAHIEFAHALIDSGNVDVIHGHSSHHILGIEIYKGKPVLYGCGDFINDYEGITGQEEFRGELSLMFFITIDTASGYLKELILVPLTKYQFRLNRVLQQDFQYLQNKINSFGNNLNSRLIPESANSFKVQWN